MTNFTELRRCLITGWLMSFPEDEFDRRYLRQTATEWLQASHYEVMQWLDSRWSTDSDHTIWF